ncbi:MAG: formylglycine-generating enzyme family protein [Spirochaetia bacterium]
MKKLMILPIMCLLAASAYPQVTDGLKTATGKAPAGFVLVPGGTFMMGSPENEDGRQEAEVQHQVTLNAFAMGATDVTVGEFRVFVKATDYDTSAEVDGHATILLKKDFAEKPDASWDNPYFSQTDQHPVVLVSWYDAVAYCNWKSQNEGKVPAYRYKGEANFLKWPGGWNTKTHNDITCDFSTSGYRLPTEAEWEYAAKGGASELAINAVFAGSANVNKVGWYSANSGQATHPVAQKRPNAFGLYDMAGNVTQLCQDWYGDYETTAQTNPRGPDSGRQRVDRGGNWWCDRLFLRSSLRGKISPEQSVNTIGFRIVCPLIK